MEIFGRSVQVQTLVVTGAAGLAVAYIIYSSRRPKRFPPGPFKLPLIGTPEMFRKFNKLTIAWHEWRVKYGDIYSIYMGRTPIIFLNSHALIREAFLTKGAHFSDRAPDPRMASANPDYPDKLGIIFTSYTEEWKKQRTLSLTILRGQGWGKSSIEHKIKEESQVAVGILRETEGAPTDITYLIGVSVSNIICSMLFGQRYDHNDEEFVSLLAHMDGFLEGQGGRTTLSYIRILKWLPSVRKAMRELESHGEFLRKFYQQKIKDGKQRLTDGEEPSDFVTNYLAELLKMNQGKSAISEDWINQIIHDFFLGGSETTTTTLRWAMLYMAKFPEVQKKVHEEIDSVFGKGVREFCLKDREKLPYTDATIMEVQRFCAMVVGTLAHITNEEQELGGYILPKNSVVVGNLYEVLHDPAVWDEPFEFCPERFIGPDGTVTRKEEWIPFSMGRRTCLGEQLAKQELFLFFTHILNAFTISPPEDTTLSIDMEFAFVAKPPPHKLCFHTRH